MTFGTKLQITNIVQIKFFLNIGVKVLKCGDWKWAYIFHLETKNLRNLKNKTSRKYESNDVWLKCSMTLEMFLQGLRFSFEGFLIKKKIMQEYWAHKITRFIKKINWDFNYHFNAIPIINHRIKYKEQSYNSSQFLDHNESCEICSMWFVHAPFWFPPT
jgi:hypothetical protein